MVVTVAQRLHGLLPLWREGLPVSEAGERAVLTAIATIIGQPNAPVIIGVGDDAAVVAPQVNSLVISTDMLTQDRHFRLEWITPHELGRRAIIHSWADCAAMAAQPVAYTVALGVPPWVSMPALVEVIAGAHEQARHSGATVVGGDVIRSDALTISVTVVGTVAAAVLLSGAIAGDELAVSGPVGAAAAGFAVLQSGATSKNPASLTVPQVEAVVNHFIIPRGPGEETLSDAHALTDISDGLSHELHTMALASHVDCVIQVADVPVDSATRFVAQQWELSILDLALSGGEDHVLLGSFPKGKVPQGWTMIGHVQAPRLPSGGEVTYPGHSVTPTGWDSFRSQ